MTALFYCWIFGYKSFTHFFFSSFPGLLQSQVKVLTCSAQVQVTSESLTSLLLNSRAQELTCLWFSTCPPQTSSVPGLLGRQPPLPGGEPGLRPAGQNDRRRRQDHRPGESDHQRQPLRPVCRFSVRLPLQGGQDVAGQHLPGVQGELQPSWAVTGNDFLTF